MGGENKDKKIDVSQREIENFLNLFNGDAETAAASLRNYSHSTLVLHSSPQPIDGVPIIKVDDLSKSYKIGREKIDVLKNISFTINKGEIVALTGPSGSGKSTLLHLLGCIDTPTNGTVIISDKDVSKLRDALLSNVRQEKIGFVFQSFYLQPFLNLSDNVAVPAMFTKTKKAIIDDRVEQFLNEVGLSQYLTHFPKQLSGGQIQRAAIARALVNNPDIVIADEPTGNLDSKNSQAIIDLFKSLRERLGTTIVIATHDRDVAEQADRIIAVKDGVLV